MASQISFKIIGIILEIATNHFGILTLFLQNKHNFVITKYKNKKITYFLFTFLFVSLTISTFDIYYNLTIPKSKNLLVIFYHGALLFIKFVTVLYIKVFRLTDKEFIQLLNCMCQLKTFNTLPVIKSTKRKNFDAKSLLLILTSFLLVFLLTILIPGIAFMFPCLQKNWPSILGFKIDCTSNQFRFFVLTFQFLAFVPTSTISCFVLFIFVVTLCEIKFNLKSLL